MEICSIGTSGISAREFFGLLKENQITSIVDSRRNPKSQLGGFARQSSLEFFLEVILNIPYIYEIELAPSPELLLAYKQKRITWEKYEQEYSHALEIRKVEEIIDITRWGSKPVILCSEKTADYCHRRLAAEYLKRNKPEVITSIKHL